MIVKSKGIVFSHFKYSETSIIVNIYTEKHGRLTFIINNAVSNKSKIKANIFQPLVLIEFDYYYNKKKEIHRIKEVQVSMPFSSIPFNIIKCTIAIFISEILEKAIKEVESNSDLFNFVYNSIIYFDSAKENFSDFHIRFLLILTKHLGFYPVNNYSDKNKFFSLNDGMFIPIFSSQPKCLDIECSGYIFNIISDNVSEINLNRSKRKMILESIINYYYIHLDGIKEIKSLKVLNEVF